MNRIKLEEIVNVISDREDNPSQSDYTKFVGLEHYDSGELKITRFGTTDNLASSVKIFKPGDTLVARRNVYLKRASYVDFDGVTSGDSIVLRPKDKKYEFILPFILNTDDFWEFAEANADGTMSKRLSPKKLVEYEFSLPDDQSLTKITNELIKISQIRFNYKKLYDMTDDLLFSYYTEHFDESESVLLKDLADDWFKGQPFKKDEIDDEGNQSCIHYGELFTMYGPVINEVISKTNSKIKKNSRRGDILFPASDVTPNGLTRCSVLNTDDDILYGGDIIVLRPKSGIDYRYLSYSINFEKEQLLQKVTGAVVKHLSANSLKDVSIKLPSIELQNQFSKYVILVESVKENLNNSLKNLTNIQKEIINKNFVCESEE